MCLTPGQDGGIGRHTVPHHTTKKTATNFKTKNHQKCQKSNYMEVRQPGVKEQTFIQIGGRVGDGQPGRRRLMAKVATGGAGEVVPGGEGKVGRADSPTFACR